MSLSKEKSELLYWNVHQVPGHIHEERHILRYILGSFWILKISWKYWKLSVKKNKPTIKGKKRPVILGLNFSFATPEPKNQWNSIWGLLREKNFNVKLLCTVKKLSTCQNKLKIFEDMLVFREDNSQEKTNENKK